MSEQTPDKHDLLKGPLMLLLRSMLGIVEQTLDVGEEARRFSGSSVASLLCGAFYVLPCPLHSPQAAGESLYLCCKAALGEPGGQLTKRVAYRRDRYQSGR